MCMPLTRRRHGPLFPISPSYPGELGEHLGYLNVRLLLVHDYQYILYSQA